MTHPTLFSRRAFLQSALALTGVATVAGCAAPTPPTSGTPAAAPASSQISAPAREATLVIAYGPRRTTPEHQWNVYSSENAHQNGSGLFYEPLFFYSAFANQLIPWLADGYTFSADHRQLVIRLRTGVTWSDGQPFSAEDVAFTLDALQHGQSGLPRARGVVDFVDRSRAVDPATVEITFKLPAPRFVMQLAYWYDQGICIVPKHVYSAQANWAQFDHYDAKQGWPLTTGPWRLGRTSPELTVIERAPDWWAARARLTGLPAVERIIYRPYEDASVAALGLRTNQLDCSDAFSPHAMPAVLESNPALTTFSGRQPPYGYADWWPISMYVNCASTEQPWLRERDVRWALSLAIDRRRLVNEAFGGATEPAPLPLPSVTAYPGLKPFQDAIGRLLARFDTLEFDPRKSQQRMESAGYQRNADGYWAKGNTVVEVQLGVVALLNDLGGLLVRQLKAAGFSTTLRADTGDLIDRFNAGQYSLMLFGHAGSVDSNPYATLALYQSTTGGTARVTASRWQNAAYDQVVDEMASTPDNDQARLTDQFRRAMEQWLPELPDIPLVEWYHRIPTNTTYWTGWPARQDPYVNTAFWHLTFPLVLNRLRPARSGAPTATGGTP